MKDYTPWKKLITEIESKWLEKYYRESEIWWTVIGLNIGFEEDGKNQNYERPVLIFRKFNRFMFWGLPLTSKPKTGKFYCSITFRSKRSTVILSQIRTLSSKRLVRRMGHINQEDFDVIEERIINLIKETDPLRGPQVPSGNL